MWASLVPLYLQWVRALCEGISEVRLPWHLQLLEPGGAGYFVALLGHGLWPPNRVFT